MGIIGNQCLATVCYVRGYGRCGIQMKTTGETQGDCFESGFRGRIPVPRKGLGKNKAGY